jgi:hypothetical protein
MFVYKVDILKSDAMKGISGFISIFADDELKLYLETSRSVKFKGIIHMK